MALGGEASGGVVDVYCDLLESVGGNKMDEEGGGVDIVVPRNRRVSRSAGMINDGDTQGMKNVYRGEDQRLGTLF